MMYRVLVAILPVCGWVLSLAGLVSADDRASSKTTIDRVMQPFVDEGEVSGIVTIVVDKDSVLHQSAIGLADIDSERPMATDSIFWIASMSKPIAGASILLLEEQGKLSLDDPISKHLPEMASLKLDDGKPAEITIQHLLTHTSGMAELPAGEAYSAKDLEEAAQRYAKVRVLFEPGSKWQYSQTSINTAARIVEVVSGLPYHAFLKKNFFDPLGMNDTTFYLSEDQLSRLATSYEKDKSGKLVPTAIMVLNGKSPTYRERMPAANGGLFSTAPDYAKFCQMLLNEGELNGKRVLAAQSVKKLRTVVTGDLVTGFTTGNGWGIGVCVVREPQGVTEALAAGSFGHGGAYGTQAWVDPQRSRAYVMMIQRAKLPNADNSDLRRTFQKAASAIQDN